MSGPGPAEAEPGPGRADRATVVVEGVRLLALGLGAALLAGEDPSPTGVGWGLGLAVLAAGRAWAARRARPGGDGGWALDLAVGVAAVVTTGGWQSPWMLHLAVGVMGAGFARGLGRAVPAALGAGLAAGLAAALGPGDPDVALAAQWTFELLLVGVLAGFARHVFGQAEDERRSDHARLRQLQEANELLVSLQGVARTLPASLDLDEVVAAAVDQVHAHLDADVVAVVVADGGGTWRVAGGEGVAVGRVLAESSLPIALRAARSSSGSQLAVCLEPGQGLGPEVLAQSGLYAPLRARGEVVGILVAEHHQPSSFGRRELQLLDALTGAIALAIDNATLFGRLRALGAAQERTRIARDLHDRLGQSLAGIAFGLDGLGRRVPAALGPEVDALRTETREALGEVRDTLGELRADVSDEEGMAAALEALLARVADRTGVATALAAPGRDEHRLPLPQERELWRIAHEAVANAARHAGASRLSVRWRCDGAGATLVVADDGCGFDPAAAGAAPSYGLVGMRERAAAVGATLEVDSGPGLGTVVRCRLVADGVAPGPRGLRARSLPRAS